LEVKKRKKFAATKRASEEVVGYSFFIAWLEVLREELYQVLIPKTVIISPKTHFFLPIFSVYFYFSPNFSLNHPEFDKEDAGPDGLSNAVWPPSPLS